MGRGYVAFEEKYKSAPGPEAHSVGYKYETAKNNAILEDLRFAATDLVAKLDQNLSFSDDKIYLTPSEPSAFYTSFDHLLRDELIKSGYMISPVPAGAVPVTFTAQEVSKDSSKKSNPYRPLYLALAIDVRDGIPARHVGGVYEIPTYDFKETGHIHLGIPVEQPEHVPASLQRIQ